ncbi:MAG: cytochrome c3 family protein [Planctomycetota bacterium]|nr:cytochrome c3 family protein [Planctomycetota bacterium]
MAAEASTIESREETAPNDFLFPAWVNKLVILGLASAGLFGGYAATIGFFATHPQVINVGHMPEQPVPFSHALHAGKLKLDCRYCHNTVENAAHAAIPASATCGNCHGGKDRVKPGASLAAVHLTSEKLAPLRRSLETDRPVEWLRVHEVPGFVYFNHSAHVTRGVSCVECHGRIDMMEVVYQAKPLSMKWCLDCHRNPDEAIRPVEEVTNLAWNPDEETLKTIYREELGKAFESISKDGHVHFFKDGDAKDQAAGYENRGKRHQNEFAEIVFGELNQPGSAAKADQDSDGRISLSEAHSYLDEFRPNPTRKDLGSMLRSAKQIKPKQNCSTCHR